MRASSTTSQSMQRVKVGMIGLAGIVLLIIVASAIIGQATRERPLQTAGAAQPAVVANIALGNGGAASAEPMAELGISPATANTAVPAAR